MERIQGLMPSTPCDVREGCLTETFRVDNQGLTVGLRPAAKARAKTRAPRMVPSRVGSVSLYG